jgi:hypothetical protein
MPVNLRVLCVFWGAAQGESCDHEDLRKSPGALTQGMGLPPIFYGEDRGAIPVVEIPPQKRETSASPNWRLQHSRSRLKPISLKQPNKGPL